MISQECQILTRSWHGKYDVRSRTHPILEINIDTLVNCLEHDAQIAVSRSIEKLRGTHANVGRKNQERGAEHCDFNMK
jgi:hypothetical protein